MRRHALLFFHAHDVHDSIFEVAMMSAGNAFLIHQFYPTRDHVRYTNCLQFF